MTQQKHLKQLVRERMTQTGLCYVAARRAVLQSADHSKSPHRPGSIAGSTTLRVLVAHAGRDVSEAIAFGLAGGVGIGIFTFCYEKEDFASFFVAGRHCFHDHVTYLNRACKRLGLSTVVKESTSPKLAEKQLRELIAAHGPSVAWVDLGALPHRGIPPSPMVMGYHLVTVYSVNDKSALIGDLTDEPIEMPLAELTQARGRIKKDKYRLLAINKTDKSLDLANSVIDALKACHAGLTGADGPKNARKNFSIDAIALWAERLTSSKDREGWEKVFTPGKRLFSGLKSIFEYIEYHGTGGGLSRHMMADFLTEASKSLKRPEYLKLADQYSQLGHAWSDLADAALPDRIEPFAETKKQFATYSENFHSGGSIDDKRNCWKRLSEIGKQVAQKFPLTAVECADLRAQLRERVLAIHATEVAAHKQLAEIV